MSTTRIKYILSSNQVNVQAVQKEEGKDPVVTKEEIFSIDGLQEKLINGDGFVSLAAYGLSQLLQDRTSDLTPKNGVTPHDRIGAMADFFEDTIKEGFFRKPSVRKAAGARIDMALIEAVAEVKGVSITAAEEALKEKTKEEQAGIAAIPRIAEIISRIKEEAGSVDLSDLGI